MEKSKTYNDTYFSADIIKRSLDENLKDRIIKSSYRLRRENESWEFDDEREFFADYRKPHENSTIRKSDSNISITVNFTKFSDTTVIVQAKTRGEIESVFEIFEQNQTQSLVPNEKELKSPIIFIGHGRSLLWRELKDHLDNHACRINLRITHEISFRNSIVYFLSFWRSCFYLDSNNLAKTFAED